MSVIPQNIKEGINKCLFNCIPFAAYRFPGGKVHFIARGYESTDSNDKVSFLITTWNRKYAESVRIETNNDYFQKYSDNDIFFPSTNADEYKSNLIELIQLLKSRGGKTVISRVISDKCNSIDWAEAADKLFEAFPNSFGHIYYHPTTGAWLGATPEILVKSNLEKSTFSTMALAGTKRIADKWDDKNLAEQKMVTDFIIDRLNPLCASIDVSPITDLEYGNISHLCTRLNCISKKHISHADICDALSPTPAVAGHPQVTAISEISKFEKHNRLCYGGYVTVENHTKSESVSFVNLRCVHFKGNRFTIYAGGGITAQSEPDKEWAETEAKAKVLKDIIYSFDNATKE